MKVGIGSDHAGFDLKAHMISYLEGKGIEVEDFGTHSSESTDYPDYAHPLSDSVASGSNKLGILICGSANGVCMTANKHQDIRAGIAWNAELAALARQHNNANVLCLPARYISEELAESIVDQFLTAEFEGGRHERRVDKIRLDK